MLALEIAAVMGVWGLGAGKFGSIVSRDRLRMKLGRDDVEGGEEMMHGYDEEHTQVDHISRDVESNSPRSPSPSSLPRNEVSVEFGIAGTTASSTNGTAPTNNTVSNTVPRRWRLSRSINRLRRSYPREGIAWKMVLPVLPILLSTYVAISR